MMTIFQDKRIVYVVRKISGVYTHIQTLNVSTYTKQLTIKSGKQRNTVPFDVGKPAFRIGRFWVYFLDSQSGQMGFQDTDFKISTDLIDTILAKGTIKNIISSLEKPPIFSFIFYIIIGLLIGLPFGYILGTIFPM